MRRHRTDTTAHPIIKALRAAHYTVELIGEPVDILVRHPTWKPNVWVMAELKTANRAGGKYQPRKDQEDQVQYCIAHVIPYWLTIDDALAYLSRVGAVYAY